MTLRYQDSVCHLGGFHASREGESEAEISQCFLNEGLVWNKSYLLSSSGPGPLQVQHLEQGTSRVFFKVDFEGYFKGVSFRVF